MKKVFFSMLFLALIGIGCKSVGTMASIEPKIGNVELPANGELRLWKDIIHPAFSVTFSNPSATQSCEIYKVKSNGNEKWISPSLQAGKTITIKVPANGHVFFKNFNPNSLKIEYKVLD